MGGNNSTTTQTSNQPWEGAIPLLKQAMGDAQKLYQGGNLSPTYTGSTVVPYSQQTMGGLNFLQQNAMNAMGQNALGGSLDQFRQTYGQDGMNNAQRQSLGGMQQFANGRGNIDTSFFDQLAGKGNMMGPPPMGGGNQWPWNGGGGDFRNNTIDLPTPGGGGMNGITPLPKGEYGGGGLDGITPLPRGETGGMSGITPLPKGEGFGGNMMGPPPMTGGGMPNPNAPNPNNDMLGPPPMGSFNGRPNGNQLSSPMGGGQGATGYGAFANGAGDIGTGRIDQLGQMATNNNPAMAGYNAFAGGAGDVSNTLQQQLAGNAGANPALSGFAQMSGQQGPSVAEQNLMNIAQGGYLNRNDPLFENQLSRATDQTANAVNQQASAMGRTGSGTNQQLLAREIGNLQNDARLGQYNQERQNQVNAIGMVDQQRNQGFNNRLGALSGYGSLFGQGQDQALNAANSASQIGAANMDRRLNGISGQGGTFQGGIGQGLQAAGMSTGVQGQNVANRMAGLGGQLNAATTGANFQNMNQQRQMDALGQQFGMGQTGMGNLGNAGSIYQSLLQGQNAPGQNLMGVGSYYEDLAGRQLNDQLRIGQDMQNAPLRNIQALLAAAGGAGNYGTSYQTAQGPRNGLSQGIGALIGGGSLLSQLFGG